MTTETTKSSLQQFAASEREASRLEARHRHVIDANIDHIRGKSVVDLACNNGRWSYAAAAAGASRVMGVEGRPEKVEEARALVEKLGVSDRVSFDVGDMYDWLYEFDGEADTVLCLGVYYHIMDHYHLLRLIARHRPACIIIDSGFVRSFRPMVHVKTENPSLHSSALPAFANQASEIVGLVSLGLMNQMAWNCGYRCEPVVWDKKKIADRQPVKDYMSGRRFTLRLTKDETLQGYDRQWKERWRPALVALGNGYEALLDPATAERVEDERALPAAEHLREAGAA
ncbi:MAG: class I SAM-dependent methyltransferase [Parvibaculum sp.]